MLEILVNIVAETWQVLGQMAPYLLFGFLVAGLLSVFVSAEWIERHLGRRGFSSVWKAALFGVPLPLCSCGVIPVSASIRRHGASRAATSAFLISTPQTGVDSILVTYGLLGLLVAVFRPVAALVSGMVGGGLVLLFGEREPASADGKPGSPTGGAACPVEQTSQGRLRRALEYGFVTLPRDIGGPLLLGALIAGAMGAVLDKDVLAPYLGGGVLSIVLMMAAGIPIYVCATASVPIALGFIHLGASPGAALAFLIAGPATNAATLTTMWKVLGRRTALVYLLTIATSSVAGGLALNWLFALTGASLPQMGSHVHGGLAPAWFANVWAMILLLVLAFSYWAARAAEPAAVTEKSGETKMSAANGSDRAELSVRGMTCSHCAQSVRRALSECPGVESAEVDLGQGRAVVVGKGFDRRQLVAAVADLGYSADVVE